MPNDARTCCELPNGCRLYVRDNDAGGRTYYSDEVGGGVFVWDTCLVADSTLLAAMTEEHRAMMLEYHAKQKGTNAL